ncbi:MAG TPA: hypothetical protein VFM18_09115 [Methanosarcina sp.]|nr:hypothetical protein [Methanosarcina sp.]
MADRISFLAFIRAAGITSTVLPDNSTDIDNALALSLEIVSDLLSQASTLIYNQAVYNLGTHNIIVNAQDVTPTVIYQNNLPYFAYWRSVWKINSFTPGVIQSTSDEGTSTTMLVPDFMKGLSMSNLEEIKTPWGRAYMAYAQKFGSMWGIS